jgi:hypothetical protein
VVSIERIVKVQRGKTDKNRTVRLTPHPNNTFLLSVSFSTYFYVPVIIVPNLSLKSTIIGIYLSVFRLLHVIAVFCRRHTLKSSLTCRFISPTTYLNLHRLYLTSQIHQASKQDTVIDNKI